MGYIYPGELGRSTAAQVSSQLEAHLSELLRLHNHKPSKLGLADRDVSPGPPAPVTAQA
jgi:hypothetical protein